MSQATALALTLAVEVPMIGLALTGLRLARIGRAVLLGMGVNLLTHPVLWWALAPRPDPARFWFAEGCVCAVEAVLLWLGLAVRRDFAMLVVLSVGANAASAAAGLLLTASSGG
jgi:Na+/melibiose symporter-like transporter